MQVTICIWSGIRRGGRAGTTMYNEYGTGSGAYRLVTRARPDAVMCGIYTLDASSLCRNVGIYDGVHAHVEFNAKRYML